MEERKILQQIDLDFNSGFELLVEKYLSMVVNVANAYTSDRMEAEDIAQMVFMKAYPNLRDFQRYSSLKTWLYRITINTCHDQSRKNKIKTVNLDYHEPAYSHTHEAVEDDEKKLLIRKAIYKLPDKFKDVVVLKDLEDLSYREIADTLNISLGTVQSRLSRAREKLKLKLQTLWETENEM